MSSFFRFYKASLQTHPKRTNALTTGLLFGLGDIVAQTQFPEPGASYDPMRTLRPFLYGAMLFSLVGDKWYRFLSTLRVGGLPQGHWGNVLARVACDQLVFAPIGVPLYFTAMALMEGGTLEDVRIRLSEKWWSTLLANWLVWPAFQLCNFSLVPVQHRLLTVNVLAIFWNTYLSYSNSTASS
ncbi:AaceriAFR120Cp [[Ashbya] aceris (nom. inval.)]|nr:AaceriAFR120Cp [[Ashbya] aceris (nom. inval.)]